MKSADANEKEKKCLHERIAELVIEELIACGLTLILVIYGLNYFELKYAWTEIIKELAHEGGVVGTAIVAEASATVKAIAATPLFRFIMTGGGMNVVLAGIILVAAGIVLNFAIITKKEELYRTVGKNLYTPGIIGIIAMVVLQIITVVSLMELAGKTSYASVFSALDKSGTFSSGMTLLGAYSDILVTGLYCTIIGSVAYTLIKARKIRHPVAHIISRTMLNSGYIFLLYYAFLRLIVLAKSVSLPVLGQSLGLFAVTSRMPKPVFMLSIAMILFGIQIKRYADVMEKEKKAKARSEQKPDETLLHQEWDALEEKWKHYRERGQEKKTASPAK